MVRFVIFEKRAYDIAMTMAFLSHALALLGQRRGCFFANFVGNTRAGSSGSSASTSEDANEGPSWLGSRGDLRRHDMSQDPTYLRSLATLQPVALFAHNASIGLLTLQPVAQF